MKFLLKIGLFVLALIIAPASVLAQLGDCEVIIDEAIASTLEACRETERGEVCYGSPAVSLQLDTNATDLWEAPGDTVDAELVSAIQSSGLSASSNTWGVTLMRLQANLADQRPDDMLTMVLFGGGELSAVLSRDSAALPDFTFQSDSNEPSCGGIPESGLLIQTPTHVQLVDLQINDAEIALDGTIYAQAVPNESMSLSVIDGFAAVTIQGEQHFAPAGATLVIELQELSTIGIPTISGYVESERNISLLPVDVLPTSIQPAVAVNDREIAALDNRIPLAGEWQVTNYYNTCDDFVSEPYTATLSVTGAGADLLFGVAEYARRGTGVYKSTNLDISIYTFYVVTPELMLIEGWDGSCPSDGFLELQG